MLSDCNNASTNTENAATPVMEKQLRDAMAKYPDSVLLTETLIQYFRDNSNFEQAILETNKAIQKDTANARLWDIKATLHFQNKDTANAIEALEKAISIDPQPAYAISLGLTYAQTKNAKALVLADALLKDTLAKAAKEALFIKGFYYSYKGALALQSTFDEAYYWMGRCYEKIGDKKEAITNYQNAIQIDPEYTEAKFALAKLGVN